MSMEVAKEDKEFFLKECSILMNNDEAMTEFVKALGKVWTPSTENDNGEIDGFDVDLDALPEETIREFVAIIKKYK